MFGSARKREQFPVAPMEERASPPRRRKCPIFNNEARLEGFERRRTVHKTAQTTVQFAGILMASIGLSLGTFADTVTLLRNHDKYSSRTGSIECKDSDECNTCRTRAGQFLMSCAFIRVFNFFSILTSSKVVTFQRVDTFSGHPLFNCTSVSHALHRFVVVVVLVSAV